MTLKEWKSKYRHTEQKAANGDVRISVTTNCLGCLIILLQLHQVVLRCG